MSDLRLPACPHLPPPRPAMDWRHFHVHGPDRGGEFYATALEYGHYLWQRGLAARAVLCLDRALGADLAGTEPVLARWPLPYAAMAWCLAHTPEGVFIGNPRVHFQHLAGRMNGPRREQRRWRAWACWAIARRVRPDWPCDPRHAMDEPSAAQIAAALAAHGHDREVKLWEGVFRTAAERSA